MNARATGCKTIAIACNQGSKIGESADLAIEPVPGPEVLTGSTRLKAGTVQKLILNMISTGAMVKIGKVYQNLMVDVQQTNEKQGDTTIYQTDMRNEGTKPLTCVIQFGKL